VTLVSGDTSYYINPEVTDYYVALCALKATVPSTRNNIILMFNWTAQYAAKYVARSFWPELVRGNSTPSGGFKTLQYGTVPYRTVPYRTVRYFIV
jgi:hypothetical protein